jgi:ABC-type Fe3+-citrate transport system substrate-binding protein
MLAAAAAVACLAVTACSTGSAGGAGGGSTAGSTAAAAAASPASAASAASGIVTSDSAADANARANMSQCGLPARQITDASGTVVTVTGDPDRVVTVQPSFADEASLAGVPPVGIGDDNDPNLIIPQIRDRLKPYTSIGLRQSPNVAVIGQLHPDLIIADYVANVSMLAQLRAIAPTIALLSDHTDYGQNLDSALNVGVALNKCTQMKAALAAHAKAMAKVKAELSSGDHRTFIFALSNKKNTSVFNYQQYATTVVSYLGLTAAARGGQFQAGDAKGTSMETLVTLNPDVVFYANENNAPASLLTSWQQSPVFQAMTASKDHAVYHVDQRTWSLMRGVTASEVIAQQAVSLLGGK